MFCLGKEGKLPITVSPGAEGDFFKCIIPSEQRSRPDPEQQILALKTLQQEFLIKTLDQSSHRAGILLSVDQGVSELHITSLTSRSMPPEANTVI